MKVFCGNGASAGVAGDTTALFNARTTTSEKSFKLMMIKLIFKLDDLLFLKSAKLFREL